MLPFVASCGIAALFLFCARKSNHRPPAPKTIPSTLAPIAAPMTGALLLCVAIASVRCYDLVASATADDVEDGDDPGVVDVVSEGPLNRGSSWNGGKCRYFSRWSRRQRLPLSSIRKGRLSEQVN